MMLTDILRHEHDLIEQALDVLRAVADGLDVPDPPVEEARALVAFFRDFADAAHHAKEEGSLFPALESNGMPRDGGPVGCMLQEHEDSRRLVAAMADAADRGLADRECREAFREAARDYAILLGQHIFKENEVLFGMAERLLPEALHEQLGAEHHATHEQALASHAERIDELARRFLGAQGNLDSTAPAASRPL